MTTTMKTGILKLSKRRSTAQEDSFPLDGKSLDVELAGVRVMTIKTSTEMAHPEGLSHKVDQLHSVRGKFSVVMNKRDRTISLQGRISGFLLDQWSHISDIQNRCSGGGTARHMS